MEISEPAYFALFMIAVFLIALIFGPWTKTPNPNDPQKQNRNPQD